MKNRKVALNVLITVLSTSSILIGLVLLTPALSKAGAVKAELSSMETEYTQKMMANYSFQSTVGMAMLIEAVKKGAAKPITDPNIIKAPAIMMVTTRLQQADIRVPTSKEIAVLVDEAYLGNKASDQKLDELLLKAKEKIDEDIQSDMNWIKILKEKMAEADSAVSWWTLTSVMLQIIVGILIGWKDLK